MVVGESREEWCGPVKRGVTWSRNCSLGDLGSRVSWAGKWNQIRLGNSTREHLGRYPVRSRGMPLAISRRGIHHRQIIWCRRCSVNASSTVLGKSEVLVCVVRSGRRLGGGAWNGDGCGRGSVSGGVEVSGVNDPPCCCDVVLNHRQVCWCGRCPVDAGSCCHRAGQVRYACLRFRSGGRLGRRA